MSFGGFGGFGSNNNNNQTQSTGFGGGGFGSPANNTNTGFGSSTNTGFGGATANTGGGLFGSNNNTSSGFGASTGFGNTANNTTSAFGAAKPAFGGGNTTGSSLFGGNANNTTGTSTGGAFGGFGSTTNNQSGGFGSSTGGGLFGSNQSKPAFGASPSTTGGGMFGGGAATSNTFGQSTGGFGQSTGGGFGQQNQTVNQGTGSTPFSAYQEKDAAANSTSHYQSISFMQPYQNFSFEELRLADYAAGRKYGNTNGQAGAFGQSTGFGGFGQNAAPTNTGFGSSTTNTGGGLFGSNNNNTAQPSSVFGQNQQQNTSTGFGSTSGGVFGQNKPAGSGLFGGTPAASNTTTGGLFGANNTQTTQTGGAFGGFGQNNNTNIATTGGGLFGNNQQTQNKPFGGFGATNNTATTTGGFGSNTGGFGQQQNNQTTGTGLFGSANNTTASSGGLFGNNQQNQQNTSTSAFGGFGSNNQTQPQQNTTGGGLFGGGGFGQNNNTEQKPGGVFGAANNTGGGLFGNNNTQQNTSTGTGLFGNNQNQQQSGGLFGNKPATGGTSLFGGGNTNTTGGGLFGNNNNQQQNQTQGGGLFGQNNNNQQKPGGLFGSTATNTGGGGLFGGSLAQNNNTGGGGLFGNNQQQNSGGGLFGNSQQNQQQSQAQSLTASLTQNPYGNDQLFAGLGIPSPSVGPLATPLTGAQKPAKRPSLVPAFKINPTASMRLMTPQKRPNGYGFSYSTYGTPGSAQGSFTPSRTSLFGSGGPQKPLSKSLSTSNLRTTLSAEDSVLAPGAFTPNYRPYSSGNSIRRLKIDRSLRTDLFGDASGERSQKRVSFDGNATKNGVAPGAQTNGIPSPGPNNALVRTESESQEPAVDVSASRNAKPIQKEPRTNGVSSRPEMEQVRGNELAIVPEDEQVPASAPSTVKHVRKPQIDQEPGEYYMIPSLQDIRDMSREQLKNVEPFIVGRVRIGKIEFSKVDLTNVDLDKIMGDTVKLNVRSATVYESGVNTPPMGKGLNVPSTITLENSWPRSSGGRLPVHERKGPRFDKHVERLKRVGGTEFLDYSPESGEWVFRVQHFTTYGLDDDDDDESMIDPTDLAQNIDNSTPKVPTAIATVEPIPSLERAMSVTESDIDDTFSFKKSAKTIPGGFGEQALFYDYSDHDMDVAHEDDAAQTAAENAFEVDNSVHGLPMDEDVEEDDQLVVGAFPPVEISAPKSILKGQILGGTPVKSTFQPNDDWAEQLQRTVSPRKQDRKALREQQNGLLDDLMSPTKPKLGRAAAPQAFSTTMDIMDSLWNQPKSAAATARGGKGFEWPYEKRVNGDADASNLTGNDQGFHSSIKPRWSADGTLSYAVAGNTPSLDDGVLVNTKASLVAEGKDVRFASVQPSLDTHNAALNCQLDSGATKIQVARNGVPSARTDGRSLSFQQVYNSVAEDTTTTDRERNVWKLAAILFDPIQDSCRNYIQGVSAKDLPRFEHQIRREATLDFWRELTRKNGMTAFRDAADYEEKALACLSCGDIEGACTTLVDGRNYHLATLVSQLHSTPKAKDILKQQIQVWRAQNVTADIPLALRAIYELISGNASVSEGKSGAPEDRAVTFGIAKQFNLDWQQSLGLRLWYGHEDLGAAVDDYVDDIKRRIEATRPTPASTVGSIDADNETVQDGLLVLLRLYAAQQSSTPSQFNAAELLSPTALTGNPFNARLPWQLTTLLNAKSILSQSPGTQDNLTTSLAAQLESLSSVQGILTASTVLLHLSTPELRSSAIRSLLSRRAALITPSSPPFAIDQAQDLVLQHLLKVHIPTTWLHSARALHAAATGDYTSQAAHLLLANARDEAHAVLCTHVGPAAVISRNYDALRELLGHFLDSGAAPKDVPSWSAGGQLFFDFVHLADLSGRGSDEAERAAVLARLVAGLPGAKAVRDATLERRVALAEMSRVVTAESGGFSTDEALSARRLARLPLADDSYARQGGKLWDLYGRALRVA